MNFSPKIIVGIVAIAFGVGVVVANYYGVTGIETVQPSIALSSTFSGIQASFCPSPACETIPIEALKTTQSRLWIAMYSFTNENLANAAIEAKNRGVDVRVIVEKQQAGGKYSQHDELAAAGIPVRIDTNPNLMHHKFAVLDETYVITGSMNWTGNGVNENNENVMVIDSLELNQQFANEFEKVWEESTPI
jgi:phosphatidylserine/phosphatidylglycerophosphate/cardiolipin synthase-like enzyme